MLREIILCLDQSGSMAASVVYSSVFGAVLASVRSLSTRLVVFDTEVVDILFGLQLGGGTDIAQALTYCAAGVTRPGDTVLVLVSDLFEGGDPDELLRLAASLVASGVTVVTLLALSDDSAPAYDHDNAGRPRRPRRAGLRLHSRPVPRPDGGGDRTPRPPVVDGRPRAPYRRAPA